MVLINTDLKIKEFLGFFRKTFPDVSITPKLHLLEDHVVKFWQLWRVGFGMLGEQGAESTTRYTTSSTGCMPTSTVVKTDYAK